MTRTEILELQGIYLDAAVGTHVFGYTNIRLRPGEVWESVRDLTADEEKYYRRYTNEPPKDYPLDKFHSCWSYMHRIVDRMRVRGFSTFHLSILEDGTASATFSCPYGPCSVHSTDFHDSHGATENGESAPVAVARAALVAILMPAEERWRA